MRTLKKYLSLMYILPFFFTFASVADQPEPIRCKIIERKGSVGLWSKATSVMGVLDKDSDLTAGKTLILKEDASLHLLFEPLIDLFCEKNTTIGFENMLIERSSSVIRMNCKLDIGKISLKAPPQSGYTLLFTLITPSATVDVSAAEIEVYVKENGTTAVEVISGSAKVSPLSSNLKSVINTGSRGEVERKSEQLKISAVKQPAAVPVKKAFKQPSIAILSVKSAGGKTNENLELISNSVASEFEKNTKAKVLFLDDVRKLLHSEGIEQLLNCFTDSCISRIGARAGVDIVIVGNLGQLGRTHILEIKMIDVLRDKLMKRTSLSVQEDVGLILKEIPAAVKTLAECESELISVVETPSAGDNQSGVASYVEKVVWIFPGVFKMGSDFKSDEVDELPVHKVKLSGFYIDRFEVTREEFEKVMGYNPSSSKGCGNCPVTDVTWYEADEYCRKVGKRLPTEAQWEYACRAGTTTPFYTGFTITSEQANFDAGKPFGGSPPGIFRGKVVPVGSFPPNPWRIHDMYGNAAEWCADWYDVAYYGNSVEKDPAGPASGKLKVVRGGSWSSGGADLRSANRMAYNPELRLNTIGFRCVKPDDSDNTNE